jgi:flagellar basal-body rod modification protein FlgD
MTSQIAQINTVGGIEKLNTTVESLLTAFGNLQAQSANDLAGRDVLVAGPSLSLAGGKATGGVSLAGAADHVAVEMLDASGQTVRTINLGASTAGVHSFTWDGKRDDGQQATDGGYRMRVTATASGTAVAAKSLTAAHVQSVNDAVTGVQLDLGAGGLQPLTAVQSYL